MALNSGAGTEGPEQATDPRPSAADPPPFLSGNEAIARGAWEAGVLVGAGYPGTPSTEILEALSGLQGVDTEWSPNEKVALEVAVGASLGGARALATMKHVGVNVAADPLFSAAYMGVRGGLVVVTADDPGMHSSQNEQDNRLFARHARIPLLEPATPDEARRYTDAAFVLSERYDTPVLLRTTTRLSHGTGRVHIGPRRPAPPRPYRKDARKNVVLPAHGRVRHRWIEEHRIPGLLGEAERWAEAIPGMGELAFITAGVPYLYVREAFPDAPVLRLGMTYPIPRVAIHQFAARYAGRRLIVVEELEPYLEEQVRALGIEVQRRRWPRYGELSVAALRDAVRGDRSLPVRGSVEADAAARDEAGSPAPLPGRPPALCPGCAHRGAFHALGRMDAIVSGDIGCYTLGALAPLDAMDACMNMGASIGMAHGMEKVLPEAQRKKLVSVIGDSTFYHSGVTGLMDLVYNGGTGTVVVLDNRTTAMTGHQEHPGSGCTLGREPAPRIDIAGVARAVGVEDVRSLDTYDLLDAWRTLDDAARADHPTVVIANKPCVLKERVSFGDGVVLDPDRCTDCLACTRLGCPAIEERDGRLAINELLCNGCTQCQQVCADCNAGIDVPLMLELVGRGRTEEAFDVVLRSNPLPAVSARVCPHPCDHDVNALGYPQAAAFAARHPELATRFPDGGEKISIRAVEQYLGDWALDHVDGTRLGPADELGRSVAVIGSGPAGLSAAWYLRRAGARVTVFESDDAPGGMLRTGIPPFRLSRDVLDRELGRWEEIGVQLRCGVRIGRDVTMTELAEEHDAVVVAVGNRASRVTRLDGSDRAPRAVIPGLEFLQRFNRGSEVDIGRSVAVIGGGNTAIDCARSARRLGASVQILYRRTEAEMPAIPDEVEEAREEGVVFRFQRNPVRIIASGGRMTGLEHRAMARGRRDESGRARPVPIRGSEEIDSFDTVILAIGEDAELDFLADSGVAVNGRIDVNFAGATSRPGVFACGDAAFDHGTVTQAVATGRRTAQLAATYLKKLENGAGA
ncbi:MAG: FAD-dependent oxidoreductase [Longimicrobiales bacterium]|nr:FAD-dependent oxidoreductase [Longimicrobiales bacterium]